MTTVQQKRSERIQPQLPFIRNSAHAYDLTRWFDKSVPENHQLHNDKNWLRQNPNRIGRVHFPRERWKKTPILVLVFRVLAPDTPDGWIEAHYIARQQNLGDRKGHFVQEHIAKLRSDPSPENEDAAILGVLWRDAKSVGGAATVLFRLLLIPAAANPTPSTGAVADSLQQPI